MPGVLDLVSDSLSFHYNQVLAPAIQLQMEGFILGGSCILPRFPSIIFLVSASATARTVISTLPHNTAVLGERAGYDVITVAGLSAGMEVLR